MSFGTPTPLQYSSRDKLFQIAPEYISYCLLLCTTSSSTYFRALKTLLLLHRTTRKTDNARALRKSYAVKTVFAPRPHDGFSSDCRYVNLALCVILLREMSNGTQQLDRSCCSFATCNSHSLPLLIPRAHRLLLHNTTPNSLTAQLLRLQL